MKLSISISISISIFFNGFYDYIYREEHFFILGGSRCVYSSNILKKVPFNWNIFPIERSCFHSHLNFFHIKVIFHCKYSFCNYFIPLLIDTSLKPLCGIVIIPKMKGGQGACLKLSKWEISLHLLVFFLFTSFFNVLGKAFNTIVSAYTNCPRRIHTPGRKFCHSFSKAVKKYSACIRLSWMFSCCIFMYTICSSCAAFHLHLHQAREPPALIKLRLQLPHFIHSCISMSFMKSTNTNTIWSMCFCIIWLILEFHHSSWCRICYMLLKTNL